MTNSIGIHQLVWTGESDAVSLNTAMSSASSLGYDLFELSLHDLDSLDLEETRRAADDHHLQLVCSRGLAFDADISSDDVTVVNRGEELLRRSLLATSNIGAEILTGPLYSALGKYTSAPSESGRRNATSVLRDLCAEAEGLGVRLGLEICNRYETNVANTCDEGLRLLDDIGSDRAFIHLDTYHMNIEEDDFRKAIRLAGTRLGYLHIGENHRGYLGSGHIDFPGMFESLVEIGYTGPITFESFSSAVISEGLSVDLAIWRNLWDDGPDLAGKAITFIRESLAAAERGDVA